MTSSTTPYSMGRPVDPCTTKDYSREGMWWRSSIRSIEAADTLYRVTLREPLPTADHLPLSRGPYSGRPIICVTGSSSYDGFYTVKSVGGDDTALLCMPSQGNELWQSACGIVLEDEGDNNNFYICKGRPPKATGAESGIVFRPLPLLFHCRCSVFGIDQVDTVNQTFHADFYVELRLRGMLTFDDKSVGLAVMQGFGLSHGMVDFLNVAEVVQEKEVWDGTAEGMSPDRLVYVIKLRQKLRFNEKMELENFPYDIQEMNLPLTFNAASSRVRLHHNVQYPSLFFHKQFQLSSVYNVVYGGTTLAVLSQSDPRESSASMVYPRCTFKVLLERKAGYYVSNVVIPLAVLTLLGPLSNAVEADGSALGTGDRLSVTLTLILTAVAYKFVVAASLPQVSYLTLLDLHVLACFAFLVVNAVENVVYPILVNEHGVEHHLEKHFVIGYYSAFAAMHLVYFGVILYNLRSRNNFFTIDNEYERTLRFVNQLVYHNRGESRSAVGESVTRDVMERKGMGDYAAVRNERRAKALKTISFMPMGPLRYQKVYSTEAESLKHSAEYEIIQQAYTSVKEKQA